MFNKKKKKESDNLVHLSFHPDVAITLYKTIDDQIRTMRKDTPERLRLMSLRASISYELWKFNICADSILAQADFSYLPEIQEGMKDLVPNSKGYRKSYKKSN